MRKPFLFQVLVLAPLLAPVAASAQSTGNAVVDSANAARAAYRRANQALTKDDLATARMEFDRAAKAWPTQPAYVWSSAYVAALAGDTASLLSGLQKYAALGVGRNISADTMLMRYAVLPAFKEVVASLESNRNPMVRSNAVATLNDATFYPEGVDYDPRTGAYYVASVHHRTIAEIRPGLADREMWARNQKNIGAMLGVRVDTARNVLWATTSGLPQMDGYTPADSAIAALLRIRISDGTIEKRYDLPPSPAGHTLGDVFVSPTGDVFMSDSNEPFVYRLRTGADELEKITNPMFRSLQGIASTADGKVLYVADYSHGLMRIDLASNAVTRVADAPGSSTLGLDGIVMHRNAIVAVQNGIAPARVMRYELNPAGTAIVKAEVIDRNTAVADEPTIGTIARGMFVYVANSQWEKYTENGVLREGAPLRNGVLLGVPLDR